MRRNAVPFTLAVLLHVIVGALLFIGLHGQGLSSQTPPGPGNQPEPIKAVVVSESDYQAAQSEIAKTQQTRTEQVQQLKQQADEARKSREQTEQELARLQKQKQDTAAATAQQQRQLQQISAQAKQEAEKKQAAEEQLNKLKAQAAAAESARVAEAARLNKIKEQQEQAQKAAADAKAKAAAEAEAKAKADAQAKAAAQAEAQRKAQLQAQLQAEENQRNAAARGQWVAAIMDKVNSNWNRPPSTPPGLDCFVKITQLPNGQVVSAVVQQCNGDAAVEQSVRTAIYKSSPLPIPDDPSVFQREIIFEFAPDQIP
ncbi:MAG: cell envelope integrity protein TolA [Gammaproteobacteria bacterium]